MRTEDFEKAIDALNLGIIIDEVKLRHSESLLTRAAKVSYGMKTVMLSLLV